MSAVHFTVGALLITAAATWLQAVPVGLSWSGLDVADAHNIAAADVPERESLLQWTRQAHDEVKSDHGMAGQSVPEPRYPALIALICLCLLLGRRHR